MGVSDLREVLVRQRFMLADGGIGTAFLEQGVETQDLPTLPLTDADRVMNLHVAYLKAGARLIETHTFSANASKLSALGIAADVYALNRRAAQLARHARDIFGEPAWILGSLGPLAAPVNSSVVPGLDHQAAKRIYRDAVVGLLAGGIDGFIVETMSDLPTVYAVVEAIRDESDLPIIITFAFSPMGTTLYGVTPEEAAAAMGKLSGGPPAVIGANCGSGPSPLLDAVIRMAPIAKALGIGLAAYPNAGQPTLLDGKIHYPAMPRYVATIAPALKEAGCMVVGGCCGTGPEHIEAIGQTLNQPAPVITGAFAYPPDEAGSRPAEFLDHEEEGRLGELWAHKFVISVELDPPRGVNPKRLLEAAKTVQAAGVDAINVGDSPMARVRLSALATARLIREEVPVRTILHFTTRDRNLMGLQSDLLGAHTLGIRNVLSLTGDPPGLGDYAHATAVYDLDSVGLVKVLAGFNQGVDALGQALGSATRFDIGVGVNPNAESLSKEAERFRRKLDAGATFAMSQPIYEADQLWRFLDVFGPIPVPLLLGVMPLVSFRQALYLHNEVPGIVIPEHALARMQGLTDGIDVGVEMMVELLEAVHASISGVYLVPSYNKVEALLPLIHAIRGMTAPAVVKNTTSD